MTDTTSAIVLNKAASMIERLNAMPSRSEARLSSREAHALDARVMAILRLIDSPWTAGVQEEMAAARDTLVDAWNRVTG